MSTTTQKSFFRNGQIREQVPLRNGRRHGLVRTWHKNGRLAAEERFAEGLLHGVCRQWNEAGQLLGKYRMIHGTGVQRRWHDHGQLQMEISTVHGEFCGRSRSWLRDGTLLSDDVYLHGRAVTLDDYCEIAAEDPSLPRIGRVRVKPLRRAVSEKHIHRVFIASLLRKRNGVEARAWLEGTQGGTRSLGRFKHEKDSAKFVQALYDAGAGEVIAPDVYRAKAGNEFADGLLVRLPKVPAKRKAIRKVAARLQQRKLGAVQPDQDIGESHLYLSMS